LNVCLDILIKPFNNSDKNSNKLEKSKVQEDLKEIMNQQCFSTFTCDTDNKQKRNPLQDFFVDEIKLTKRLLNIIRADMDTSSFDDNEVKQIILFYNLIFKIRYFFVIYNHFTIKSHRISISSLIIYIIIVC